MSKEPLSTDPVIPASAALAVARKVRAYASPSATANLCPKALDHINRVIGAFDDLAAFTEGFLDDLRGVIAWYEDTVAAGTTTGYETYDAWAIGGETTAVHPVERMTPEAQHLNVVLADLRRMASLIERTLDLVAAHAIVVGLRTSGSLATAPWRRPPASTIMRSEEGPSDG